MGAAWGTLWVPQTIFMKIEENEHVLITHARSTFVHASNNAGFAFHSVAAARSSFCENVLETAAKP